MVALTSIFQFPTLFKTLFKNLFRAQGEVTVRESLHELTAWSKTAEVGLYIHKRKDRQTSLIKDWKEIFHELGNKQSLLSSLKESPFFKAFMDTGILYESKMIMLDQCLRILNEVQRKWLYLEPILFGGSLPSEKHRFHQIDNDFRGIMSKVEDGARLFDLADDRIYPDLKSTLETNNEQLNHCQKSLCNFLEQKRAILPRFYFVGDDDLLEILGQSNDPNVMQRHFKNLFQAIKKVSVRNTTIHAFESSHGEVVGLSEVSLDAMSKM